MDLIYLNLLGSFKNCNIIKFTNKITSNENFDEIHNISIDEISENMASLDQTGKYGEINTTYAKKRDIVTLFTCLTCINYKETQLLTINLVRLGNFLFGKHTSVICKK